MKRKQLMQDKLAYDAFKKRDSDRAKKYRQSLSEEKHTQFNEKAKIRMRRYRERQAQQPQQKRTRFSQDKQREYWRIKKREQRSKLTLAQKESEKATPILPIKTEF